jgi:hypothetical protein
MALRADSLPPEDHNRPFATPPARLHVYLWNRLVDYLLRAERKSSSMRMAVVTISNQVVTSRHLKRNNMPKDLSANTKSIMKIEGNFIKERVGLIFSSTFGL